MPRKLAAAALAAACLAASASAGERPAPRRTLAVAAAASVKPVMDELARAFEAARPGAEVAITAGASGAFFAQIGNGAPYDLFFSADREYPRKLAEAGLADEDVMYAVGTLVMWTPERSAIDLSRGLGALADPAVKKIAIANPAVAPYGRAAMAALEAAGVLAVVRDRLVLGQSVSQAAQFAQTGAADVALVPRALTGAPALARGRTFPVPPNLHPPLEHSAVILRRTPDPALAKAFLAFVTGPAGRDLLVRSGYDVP